MAHDIFISYSSKNRIVADAVCARLEAQKMRCWYAPRDILTGESWAGSINRAIHASRILVLIFTDDSNASRQVLREVNIAASLGIPIVPLRLTGTSPTDDLRFYLSGTHWLDAMDDRLSNAIEELCAYCAALLDNAAAKNDDSLLQRKKRKKRSIAAGAVFAVLILCAVLWRFGAFQGKAAEGYLTESESKEIVFSTISRADAGDYVAFGAYEQDGNEENGKEAITWFVLERQPDSLVLLSLYGLDCRAFSDSETGSAWSTSDVRKWLNEGFYQAAFAEKEQERILTHKTEAAYNQAYGTDAGEGTDDAVFLLSTEEAEKLPDPALLKAGATPFLAERGVTGNYSKTICNWWLRTPGCSRWRASAADYTGEISDYGTLQNTGTLAVRPVITVKAPHRKQAQEKAAAITPELPAPSETNIPEEDDLPFETITFGRYEQDGDPWNGAEPIEWIILAKEDEELLLVSKAVLDTREFHAFFKPDDWYKTISFLDSLSGKAQKEFEAANKPTWAASTLRKWLNSVFLYAAFNETERAAILTSSVTAEKNPRYGTSSGEPANDLVFLPGIAELKTYFTEPELLRASFTPFAVAESGNTQKWWLRTRGADEDRIMCVDTEGTVDELGEFVKNENRLNYVGIRPMLRIRASYPAEVTEEKRPEAVLRVTDAGTVLFGRYEQDGDRENGPESIEWLILDQQEESMLLMSRLLLDSESFKRTEPSTKAVWETSTLRKWLNGPFRYAAFNDRERELLCLTEVKQPERDQYFDSGNDTLDYVFLADFAEIEKAFPTEESRIGLQSDYALQTADMEDADYWLRTGGRIWEDGSYTVDTISGKTAKCYLRPVIRVKTNGGNP